MTCIHLDLIEERTGEHGDVPCWYCPACELISFEPPRRIDHYPRSSDDDRREEARGER